MPFRFARIPNMNDKVLITSETGEYYFLNNKEFSDFVNHKIDSKSNTFLNLSNRSFLYKKENNYNIETLSTQYRTKKSFIRDGPKLHIIVVSLRCDHSCFYCQVSRQSTDKTKFDISDDSAKAVIERIFESSSTHLTVEFQGGEPLLAFEKIKFIVELINNRNKSEKRNINYVICSTLHFLDKDNLKFIKENKIFLSTSLDGPEWLHNSNRPTRTRDSYKKTIEGIKIARKEIGGDNISALTTLTKKILNNPKKIIDCYKENKFSSIFLRPLSPYGFAVKSKNKTGYQMKDFVDFYKIALDYLIKINKDGYKMQEYYTTTLLTHILTPFPTGYVDLRSPTGAGFGVLVYNYDGYVYPSDESRMLVEMGDLRLRLGRVEDNYDKLFSSEESNWLISASVAESLPGCADCAYVPYCGADPVYALAKQDDPIGHRPTSDFCTKQMGLFNELFLRIEENNEDTMKVFLSWLRNKKYKSIQRQGYRGH